MDAAVPLSALGGFAFFAGAHAGVHRARPSNSPRMAAAALLGAAGLGVAVCLSRDVVGACASGWLYLAAYVLYLFVYAGLARSVSVTLLERLVEEGGRASFDALVADYEKSARFDDRLELMSASGLLRLERGAATLTPKGRALAAAARRLGALLGRGMEG